MESPLSPVIINIFMEYFEDLAISTSELKPYLWLCYVDDTFVIWKHGDHRLQSFWDHLNSMRPTIKFTMKEESGGQLPFLDVLVKQRDQQLETSVHQKATHMNSYINYKSNHHPATKIGIITCLKRRAERICKGSTDNLKKELDQSDQ